jgi:transglutaminase-like putative cysteine protease
MDQKSTTIDRWWDLPAAALLSIAVLTAATRLVATQWTDDLELAQTISLLGLIIGMLLGQSKFSARLVGFLATAYGVFFVPWQIASLYASSIGWPERIQSITGRLGLIIGQIIRQETVIDSLLFLVLMVALFWILSVHAAYTIVRYGQAWQAIFPSGIALFLIHSFDAAISRRVWFLAFYLFFALVLVARLTYLQRFSRWQKSRISLPPHLSVDFIRTAILATAIMVIFAWTAPALAETFPSAERAWEKIKQPYNVIRDRFDNAFASLRSSVGIVTNYYGDSVFLGRGNVLSDQQIMQVIVPTGFPSTVRLYWRARTYDTYQNGQWLSTIISASAFDPEVDNLVYETSSGRIPGVFEFYPAMPISTIYTPAQPNWISRPSVITAVRDPDGNIDISGLRAEPGLAAGEVYSVQASPPNATVAELREASTEYPEWVTERYLQLPETITDRTRALAEEIAAGHDNPYDIAFAVTNWLRSNITYADTIAAQPARQDAIDWFLFDLRQGFCNYYASAEVILLRSLGIPARFSVGYAQGEKLVDPRYYVRQRDAHAWPEVYFPDIGWVEFEPTASQPLIVRLSGGAIDNSGSGNGSLQDELRQMDEERRSLLEEQRLNPASPIEPVLNPIDYLRIILAVVAGLTVLALIMRFFLPPLPVLLVMIWRKLGWEPSEKWLLRADQASQKAAPRISLPPFPVMVEKSLIQIGVRPPAFIQRWSQLVKLPSLSRSYLEVNRALGRVGQPGADTDTPNERADQLGAILPAAANPAQQLVAEYQLSLFSTQEPDIEKAYQASQIIRKLSLRKMVERWLSRLQESPRSQRRSLFQEPALEKQSDKTFEI